MAAWGARSPGRCASLRAPFTLCHTVGRRGTRKPCASSFLFSRGLRWGGRLAGAGRPGLRDGLRGWRLRDGLRVEWASAAVAGERGPSFLSGDVGRSVLPGLTSLPSAA